jgi:hypothetical protein
MRRTIVLAGVLTFVSAFLSGVTLWSFASPPQPVAAQGQQLEGQQLEGSWIVGAAGNPPGGPNSLFTFTADGSLVGSTIAHPTQSPFYGAWVRTGDREFAFTHWRFRADASGTHLGSQKVRAQLTLNETATEFTGQGVTEIYDVDGNLVSTIPFANQGQRITVEPVP